MNQNQNTKNNETTNDKFLVITEREKNGLNVMISAQATATELRGIADCLIEYASEKEQINKTVH